MGVRTAPSTGEVPPIQTAGEGAVLPTETAADQETQQGKLCGNLQKHSAACSVFIFSVFPVLYPDQSFFGSYGRIRRERLGSSRL